MSARLYHLVTAEDWRRDQMNGFYRPPSLAREGFIHLSRQEQLEGTANLYFKGARELLLLELEIAADESALRWEPAAGAGAGAGARDGMFPHYYGALAVAAVRRVIAWAAGNDGRFSLPASEVKCPD